MYVELGGGGGNDGPKSSLLDICAIFLSGLHCSVSQLYHIECSSVVNVL